MFFPLITLLGGACGGYIPFSGAHRLLETGERTPAAFRRAAVLGASVSGLIRLLLFFCVIGACCAGRAFLSERAAAIVKAVTNYQDFKMIAELSSGLGEAMVGINPAEIKIIMEERGI